MSSLCYCECATFPGEVEDYYCTTCHAPCSGLALLVGPHTGHSRVPLAHAAQYLPAALHRDARALAREIRDECDGPRAAHTATRAALDGLRAERARAAAALAALQLEVQQLDARVEAAAQRHAAALCGWARRRAALGARGAGLLRGADALAKAIGLRGRSPSSGSRALPIARGEGRAAVAVAPDALRAAGQELRAVEALLAAPLALLEGRAAQGAGSAARGPRRPSDSAAVMHAMLDARRAGTEETEEMQRTEEVQETEESEWDERAGGSEGRDESAECSARRQWRRDVQRREQMLRDALNQCLISRGADGNTGTSTHNNSSSSTSSSGVGLSGAGVPERWGGTSCAIED